MKLKSYDIEGVIGMNNVQRPERLKRPDRNDPRSECADLVNVDVDDFNQLSSRPAPIKKYSGVPANAWSDPVMGLTLFTEGSSLKVLSPTYTAATIRSGLRGSRVVYQRVNDIVLWTDGFTLGAVRNGLDVPIPTPTHAFKTLLPGGQCLALYRRRAYVANGATLYFGDAGVNIGRMDIRLNQIPLEGYITMVQPVDDGIYVSHNGKTAFLAGGGPNKFEYRVVDRGEAFLGSNALMDGAIVGMQGTDGSVAMWMTENGVVIGKNSGVIENITQGVISLNAAAQAYGVVRSGAINQYITLM